MASQVSSNYLFSRFALFLRLEMWPFASLSLFSLVALQGLLANPTLLETITGANFFDKFEHQAIADPTNGRV
jgi:hypothetical protein